MRFARGMFRLWAVLSVLWLAGAATVTWAIIPVDDWVTPAEPSAAQKSVNPFDQFDPPKAPPPFDPAKAYTVDNGKERMEVIRNGALWATIPPTTILVLGLLFAWVAKGFRAESY